MSAIDTSMNADTLAERLQAVLDQVWHIRPDWANPERFHEARSEAVASLKCLIAEAGQLQGSSPVVTAKAKAALRLLGTAEGAAELPETVTVPPGAAPELPEILVDPALEIPVPTDTTAADLITEAPLPVEPTPIVSTACAELVELQRAIAAVVSSLTAILADIEKLALMSRASVAAYASALAQPSPVLSTTSLIAPGAMPPAATPVAAPVATADPDTFYSRRHLQTPDGMATAAALWADGVARADIGRCFGYDDHHGAACISAAIATFLRLHCRSAEEVTIAGEAGKELARRTLSAIGFKPGHKLASPAALPVASPPVAAPSARRSNGHAVRSPAPRPETPEAPHAPAVPDLPALSPRQYPREDLKTDRGRARAAELWLQGYGQQAISEHFGYARHGIAYVSLAIAAFSKTYGQAHVQAYCGNKRKPFVRKALNRFRATATPRQSCHGSAGDVHAEE